jgi:hypothetical protein
MAKCGYAISTEGEVALSAAVAKTVLGVRASSTVGLDLKGIEVDFDGVTAANEPVLIEVATCTFATNPPGTNSTGIAETQIYGRLITADFTAAKNWSAEPTVITAFWPFSLDPNKGLFDYEWPLGETPDCAENAGFIMRLNAPQIVSCRARMRLEHA